MKYKTINEEVLYTTEAVPVLDADDMNALKGMASKTRRNRVRLCTHESPDSELHEMFIVHERSAYVRPHKHRNRDESFQVLSGEADIVIFDDNGEITDFTRLGEYGSGKPFYCRLPMGTFHMVIIRSETLVFCEATVGPFNPENMEFASWAPEDGEAAWEYVASISKKIEGMAS